MATPIADSYSAASGVPVYGGRYGLGGRLSGEALLAALLAGGGMGASASELSGEAVLGGVIAGGSMATLETFQIAADGIWTWFSDPRARVAGDYLYTMAVDSAGTCRIHKTDIRDGTTTSANLSSVGLEIDDHNNGTINFLSDGRLLVTYGKHNDTTFRYKVSTNPYDITAWSAEQARGTGQGPYSYPNIFTFTNYPGRHYLFTRRGGGGGAAPALSLRTCDDITTFPASTWSAYSDEFLNTGNTPYWKLAHDGDNRLHVIYTDRHPVQGQSSVYHFYYEVDGSGVLKRYESDGTEITASLPIAATDGTLIYDGSSTKAWISEAAIGSDGHPRALWMRYPGNDGSAIEYWHARWTGSAWTTAKITDDGAGLYSPEVYYHGGLCFDASDPNTVYLSAPVSGVRQIQRWTTSDNGATWVKQAELTSGGTAKRLRPFSPVGHDGRSPVIWFEGTYTTFTSYSTAVKGLRAT